VSAAALLPQSELVPQPEQGRIFEREVMPGLADATATARVRLDALARWLQDIAFADVADAGLADRGAWVVRRSRLRVGAFPRFGEPVSVRTFCSAAGRVAAERRTTVAGAGADVEAVAIWIHVDPETLRPLRLGEDFDAVYGESAGRRKADFRLRHPEPPADAARTAWRFRASDLDLAGHVNNAAYWSPVEEAIWQAGDDPVAADMEIEYREPAQPGEAQIIRAGTAMWVAGPDDVAHASIVGLPEAPR
jgi:acyl-ACP thioesterase